LLLGGLEELSVGDALVFAKQSGGPRFHLKLLNGDTAIGHGILQKVYNCG
jgi:hypothetical protein